MWILTTAARTVWNTSPLTSGLLKQSIAGGDFRPVMSLLVQGKEEQKKPVVLVMHCWLLHVIVIIIIMILFSSRRSKHTVVAYRDAIYVFGGDNG